MNVIHLGAQVALLAEGVDRNFLKGSMIAIEGRSPSSRRAWIEIPLSVSGKADFPSPSSRRAWIEILPDCSTAFCYAVALLAEGVDRNSCVSLPDICPARSPSSRRAWIEIDSPASGGGCPGVALLAEGVDRNDHWFNVAEGGKRRPPRGGRG